MFFFIKNLFSVSDRFMAQPFDRYENAMLGHALASNFQASTENGSFAE